MVVVFVLLLLLKGEEGGGWRCRFKGDGCGGQGGFRIVRGWAGWGVLWWGDGGFWDLGLG